jgi:hypothetical protein
MSERPIDSCFPKNAPVHVVLLNGSGNEMTGHVRDSCGGGFSLVLPSAIAAGTPVRMDFEGNPSLGEVVYSLPAPSGFLVGIRVDSRLNELLGLLRQVARTFRGPV